MHEWLYSNAVALFTDIALAPLKRDNDTPRVECKFKRHSHHSDPAEIARRSVLIPDNHGSEYVVSHSRRPVSHHRRRTGFRKSSGIKQMPLSRRKEDTIGGNVALMVRDVLIHVMKSDANGT